MCEQGLPALFFPHRTRVHSHMRHYRLKQDHMAPTDRNAPIYHFFFFHSRGEGILMKVKYVRCVPFRCSSLICIFHQFGFGGAPSGTVLSSRSAIDMVINSATTWAGFERLWEIFLGRKQLQTTITVWRV